MTNEHDARGPMERASDEYDPQIARLPHPYRLMAALERVASHTGYKLGEDDYHLLLFGREAYDALIRMLAEEPLNHVVLRSMSQRYTTFRTFVDASQDAPGTTLDGNTYWLLDYLRWRTQGRHFFETTTALEQALQRTDIGEGIPAMYVRPPFPVQYICFGEAQSSPYFLVNAASGRHTLEGAYALTGIVSPGFPESGQRFLEFVFTGSAYGKANSLDDATAAITLTIPDENATMLEVLENALEHDDRHGRKREAADAANIRDAVFHASKVLLYLNSEKVVKTAVNDRAELLARIARMKGGGKVAKLQRQLPRAIDRIVIGPKTVAPSSGSTTPGASGRHVIAHWRRGHFRNQRVGPGRTGTRLTWIEPMLIHAEDAVSVPESKPYVVGEPPHVG